MVMMGILSSELSIEEGSKELKSLPKYDFTDFVHQVSTEKAYEWQSSTPATTGLTSFPLAREGKGEGETRKYRIVVIDYGVKYNIQRIFSQLGCQTSAVPCTASAKDVLALDPDGIVLSPGPGDPALGDLTPLRVEQSPQERVVEIEQHTARVEKNGLDLGRLDRGG